MERLIHKHGMPDSIASDKGPISQTERCRREPVTMGFNGCRGAKSNYGPLK